jgi:uncharacterized protein (DUF2249 family)
MLPGFFLAINLMLGDDVIEDQQARYRAIIKQLQETNGDAFEWVDAYEDPEADRLAITKSHSGEAYAALWDILEKLKSVAGGN